MVAYGPQMAHAQAERLNQSGRCRNPTAGTAPWLAREENPNVAVRGGGEKIIFSEIAGTPNIANHKKINSHSQIRV